MMRESRLREIVARARYLDWRFRVITLGHGWLVQAVWEVENAEEKQIVTCASRPWYVSPKEADESVEQTLRLLVLAEVEHEARASFRMEPEEE